MKEELKETPAQIERDLSRRRFLGYASLAGAGLLVAACHKDHDGQVLPSGEDTVDLGTADTGLLNYAYALEQLQAAFYTRVCSAFFANVSVEETRTLPDIRDHEITHREFLRNVLEGKAIADLEFDFSSVNFGDRTSVLTAAKEIEDLIISAYLNISKRFATQDYMLAIMKILSVESRHSAYVRDILTYNTFASFGNNNTTDVEMIPEDVIAATAKYFKKKLLPNRLPKP